MRIFSGLILFVLTINMVPLSCAQSPEALAAYQLGDYRRALALALVDETEDSLAFAARAILAEGIGAEPADMDKERLATAAQYAERALELNSNHDEARLQLAIVLSLRARAKAARPAYRARLGQRARTLGEAVAQETPGNAYAHGFLAVWHVEVIRRGGRLGALFLGASMSEAKAHYSIAADLFPSDAALHWQWARALAAANPKKYAAEIEAALDRVEAAMPGDQLSQVLKSRAQRFRQASADLSTDEIRQMAAALL